MCIDNKIQLYLKIIIQLKKLFVIVKFVVWQVHVRYSIVEVHLLFSQFKNAFFLSNRIWVEVMSRGDVKLSVWEPVSVCQGMNSTLITS